MSVNFSFAYHQLGYPAYSPPYSFLFVPDHSPLISMGRMFLAGDRVDPWLWQLLRGWPGIEARPLAASLLTAALLAIMGLALFFAGLQARIERGK